MQIVLATNNLHKIREIKKILSHPQLEILTLNDFSNFPSIEETGKILEENAILKAKVVYGFTKVTSLADDSGLEVDYLDGAPGVVSARFAGKGCSFKDNNLKLLKLLKDIPESQRKATFRCVVAIAFSNKRIELVEGKIRGVITEKEIGENGFGYDPVFYLPKFKKTFAQLETVEKNQISHRANAFKKALKTLLFEMKCHS
jgi:XTP/dITP diphosphohydrolase